MMNLRNLSIPVGIYVLALLFELPGNAQSVQRLGESMNTGNSSLLTKLLRDRQTQRRPATTADLAVVRFKPVGDSGVAKTLAEALGGTPQQQAALTEAFRQIKQGYEVEVAKEGKSNNLAAAFTFFIAANVMAYMQSEPPSDPATDALFADLQAVIASVPAFAKMSNLEKQQMHDWLVCIGGFAMSGYLDAKQTGDKNSLSTYREFATYAIQLVLGIEASKLTFKGNTFSIAGDSNNPVTGQNTNAQAANSEAKKIVGVWSKSASSPWGLAPGTVVTNAGYYKGQYQFTANGTYSFKGESWGGYLRSDEFWTIIENGSYAVSGDTLTISPAASIATQRNRAGVIQKTQNNALEKMSYKWQLHYFEGIGETNLVLAPQRQTQRDGSYAGNSAFPNSYLYSQGSKLEWRF